MHFRAHVFFDDSKSNTNPLTIEFTGEPAVAKFEDFWRISGPGGDTWLFSQRFIRHIHIERLTP